MMVSPFVLSNALCNYAFDLQRKCHDGVDDKELLLWSRNRLYSIKHQYKQFLKFSSPEYRKLKVKG